MEQGPNIRPSPELKKPPRQDGEVYGTLARLGNFMTRSAILSRERVRDQYEQRLRRRYDKLKKKYKQERKRNR